jgi:urease subunit gamma/beta
VQLTPSGRDRLLLFTAAELARARRARGLRLNVPEATALIADTVCEAARDGRRLSEAIAAGRSVLTPDDVLPGVPNVVREVQVEAVFDDGTRLAVVTEPFGPAAFDPEGPGGVLPAQAVRPEPHGDDAVTVEVTNTASVPISVTSHFHFFEVNPRLRFDRAAAYGRHLAVPAGTAVRFDPAATRAVRLVPFVGARVAVGFALGAAAAAELIGPRTRVIEAPGKLVLPGFQDAHVHAPFAGRNRLNVDLNGLAGLHAYLDCIAAYAAAHPDAPWIVGGGWAMEYFPGGTQRKEDLDAIAPDRPVFLFNRDVHGAWVNSAALAMAGIDKDTPDPVDGRIERDPETGEPTGTLHEGAAYTFNDRHVPLELGTEGAGSHVQRSARAGWFPVSGSRRGAGVPPSRPGLDGADDGPLP